MSASNEPSDRPPDQSKEPTSDGFARLPPLAKRVWSFAVPEGLQIPHRTRVRLTQAGEIRLKPEDPWKRLTASQTISPDRTEFRWRAWVSMAPGFPTRVTDAFEEGRGRLSVKLWGLMRVAASEGPAVDKGQIMRYLAELPLCPPAYVRNPGLTWDPVDDTTIRVGYAGAGFSGAVGLQVDAKGRVVGWHASRRPRKRGQAFVETPWSGTYSEYREMSGFQIPTRAEATWHLPAGPFVYFRARIKKLALLDVKRQ
ncbi:MAG: DUF6544 family protein [Elusimicrobiota bacterium]